MPRTNSETFNIEDLITMASARASRGEKLRTVRIIGGRGGLDPDSALELGKYVSHVEYAPKTGAVDNSSDGFVDDSDEESDEESGDGGGSVGASDRDEEG